MTDSRSRRPRSTRLAALLTALAATFAVTACDDADEDKEESTAKADAAKAEADAKAAALETKTPDAPAASVNADAVLVKDPSIPLDTTPAVNPEQPNATELVELPGPDAKTAYENNTIEVFEAAAPATVFVTQTQLVADMSMRTIEVPAGAGTGYVWDADGHIVTNCHVALVDCAGGRQAPKLSVSTYDHKNYDASLVGFDALKDIAVLKIVPDGKLIPIRQPPAGHSLMVGQKTIAIGNPFGLDHTLTVGVISALGREVVGIGGVTIRDMVQTDAAINPGNSGGPLLDSQGRLIGMNTMIFSRSGSSAGIGFAVPYSAISKSVPEIIKDGHPARVGLGITKLDDAVAMREGVEGVIVDTVSRTSPAFAAGLRGLIKSPTGLQYDVIVGVGTERVKVYDDLYKELEGKAAGETIKLQIMRMPGKKVFSIETELVAL
jgi:S1-C subfamily serine protease